MELFALGALVVVGLAALVGGVAALAGRVARSRDSANQVVPGVPTEAPAAWAGAHSTEARLHRRLRAAVDAAGVAAPGADGQLVGLRRAVEEEALAVDRRLVVAAAAPAGTRDALLARVAAQVAAVEEAAGALSGRALDEPGPARREGVAAAVDDALTRARLLAEARAEVEEVDRRQRGEAALPEQPATEPASAASADPATDPAGDPTADAAGGRGAARPEPRSDGDDEPGPTVAGRSG